MRWSVVQAVLPLVASMPAAFGRHPGAAAVFSAVVHARRVAAILLVQSPTAIATTLDTSNPNFGHVPSLRRANKRDSHWNISRARLRFLRKPSDGLLASVFNSISANNTPQLPALSGIK